MKNKALIISSLIASLLFGIIADAEARRGRWNRGYGPRYCRPQRVWVAPAPPVVIIPRYGYRQRGYSYNHPRYYRGQRSYGYSHPRYRRR